MLSSINKVGLNARALRSRRSRTAQWHNHAQIHYLTPLPCPRQTPALKPSNRVLPQRARASGS